MKSDFEKRLGSLEEKVVGVAVDMQWIKRIVIGAAGLGFLEKLIGWMVK